MFHELFEKRTAQSTLSEGIDISASVIGYTVVIGPSHSKEGPCPGCVQRWYLDTLEGRSSLYQIRDDPWPTYLSESVKELLEYLSDQPSKFLGRVACLNVIDGSLSWHNVHVHPLCSRCSPMLEDGPNTSRAPHGSESLDWNSWRVRRFERETLRSKLLDRRMGPILHLSRDELSPLSLTMSETLHPGRGRIEEGFGRGASFSSSEVPALLEGLERTMSASPLGRKTNVVGSFDRLKDDAIDPISYGLPTENAVNHPEYRLTPYQPDLETSWVWAWSTLQQRHVLVPAHVAYWDVQDGYPRFLYESSNGCALGGSFNEAVLYGLFEVIERDAFLLSWHAGAKLQEVIWDHLPIAHDMAERLIDRNMRLRVLDMTTEFGVPAMMAVVTATEEAVDRGTARALNIAAGAHPDPDRAMSTAIEEAATNALMYPYWRRIAPSKYSPEKFKPMREDFTKIRTLDDHTGVYGLNESRALWKFLDHTQSTQNDPNALASTDPPLRNASSTGEALSLLLRRIHQLGLDVIVIDQTAETYRKSVGVHCVKVIIPGTVPMTFGHLNDRSHSIERIQQADKLLENSLSVRGPLNAPIPHPFP